MRDKNQNYIQFSENISQWIQNNLNPKEIGVLRNPVVDSPTLLNDEEIRLVYQNNNLLGLRGLALISYYLPEILGWRIRMDLWKYSRRLSLKDQLKLKLLLNYRESALVYFYETNEFTSHEIFGNILKEGLILLQTLKIIGLKIQPVSKPQRRRGYNDKGFQTPDHKWKETDLGYIGDNLQNEIEMRRYLHKRTYHYLENYLSERANFYNSERNFK